MDTSVLDIPAVHVVSHTLGHEPAVVQDLRATGELAGDFAEDTAETFKFKSEVEEVRPLPEPVASETPPGPDGPFPSGGAFSAGRSTRSE
jgi:hypothetical protein